MICANAETKDRMFANHIQPAYEAFARVLKTEAGRAIFQEFVYAHNWAFPISRSKADRYEGKRPTKGSQEAHGNYMHAAAAMNSYRNALVLLICEAGDNIGRSNANRVICWEADEFDAYDA